MPATIVNDPVAIHQYRDQIGERMEELKANLAKTEGAIETVSESWKDSQFQQFRENFNQDKERIGKFYGVLESYKDNILLQLQQRLEDYMGINMHL